MRLLALFWMLTISAESYSHGFFQTFENLLNSVLVIRSGGPLAADLKVDMPTASPEFIDEETLRVFVAPTKQRSLCMAQRLGSQWKTFWS